MVVDCLPKTKSYISPTIEDYLRLIYNMQRDGEPSIAVRLKDRLGVSGPTVWSTLRRMGRDGLLVPNPKRDIELSDTGLAAAEGVIRRHMLAERFLTDVLKLPWPAVNREAHRMEHAIPGAVEQGICRLLGNPKTCPHGNPIPGLAEPYSEAFPLTEAVDGDELIVNNVLESAEEDEELLQDLHRSGVLPDCVLKVEAASAYGAVRVVVMPGGESIALTRRIARAVLVRRVSVLEAS